MLTLTRVSVLALACSLLPFVGAGAQPRAEREITLALTGDSIITRRLSVYQEPEFLQMIELIRGADMAFTNLEMLFHDYEPYPAHASGGTYMRAEPELLQELVWAGFDMVSTANNHTGDYGPEGMRITNRHLREAGLVYAGSGEDLHEAREARFLETHNGRVALIGCASTFPDHSMASYPRGAVRGRPGLSPLRYSRTNVLPEEQFHALREALNGAGFNGGDETSFHFGDEYFELGETAQVTTEPNPQDVAEIAYVVNNAARLADYVIVSIHAHERGSSLAEPADFLVTFARAMIDAGADVFVGHGPHVLRGIEIYNGKPIFYSLGDFIFQNETVLRLPKENYQRFGLPGDHWGVADFNRARYSNDTRGFPTNPEIWESVVALPKFREGRLTAVELHPITLGFGKPTPVRGRPMLADEELGRKIINDLTERSAPFDTVVEWRDGIGVVKLD